MRGFYEMQCRPEHRHPAPGAMVDHDRQRRHRGVSQFPTRADLTTTPMTEVEELPPGGDRQSREGDYLSLVTHTS